MKKAETTAEPEVLSPDQIIAESNAPLITQDDGQRLLSTLKPIVPLIAEFNEKALVITVGNKAQADAATAVLTRIKEAQRTVEDTVTEHIDKANRRHKLWTSFRARFLNPFEEAHRKIKRKVLDWEEEEERKAEAERRRLQAIEDEKARKEEEALRKRAAEVKSPEKKQELLQRADQVVAPTIQVEAQSSGVRKQLVWVAEIVDAKAFLSEATARPELMGFVTIDTTKLQRTKAANKMFSCRGIKFSQVAR